MAARGENQLAALLGRFAEHVISPQFDILELQNSSVFPNGRHVCLVEMRGALADRASSQEGSVPSS
jgi:hypothetical protein